MATGGYPGTGQEGALNCGEKRRESELLGWGSCLPRKRVARVWELRGISRARGMAAARQGVLGDTGEFPQPGGVR